MDVTYDKAKKYEGELFIANNKLMGSTMRERVKFYKGKCGTRNLFSFFDASVQEQTFNPVEKRYRDKLIEKAESSDSD